MPNADSQVSRTHLPFATPTTNGSVTWDYDSISGVDTPRDDREKRAYRHVLLEAKILPSLTTHRGQARLLRRWYAVPDDLDALSAAGRLEEALSADEELVREVARSVGQTTPERPGRSLALPSPAPRSTRWQGATQWVQGALVVLASSRNRRLRRVSACHWKWILQALASYADHASGHNVTAANLSVGRRAAALFRSHTERGGGWLGRRTDELSPRTLTDSVGCVVAALVEAGWIAERARGRHLTRAERVLAFMRHHIHQTKAASVRDLLHPEDARSTPPPPGPPRWAHPSNSSVQAPVERRRMEGLRKLAIPVLRTHPAVGRLSEILLVCSWLLTRTSAPETLSSPPKISEKAQRRPSIHSQRLAAELVERLPWLLRSPRPGRRVHLWTVARLLEPYAATTTAAQIITHIDSTLCQRKWELHPENITHPLGWLTAILRSMTTSAR